MSRKEVVLVVSRAVAVIQIVTVLLEMTYIPGRLYSLSHHSKAMIESGSSETSVYLWTDDRISLAMYMLRIIILMIVAALFWTCGPKVEQLLCPIDRDHDSNPPSA